MDRTKLMAMNMGAKDDATFEERTEFAQETIKKSDDPDIVFVQELPSRMQQKSLVKALVKYRVHVIKKGDIEPYERVIWNHEVFMGTEVDIKTPKALVGRFHTVNLTKKKVKLNILTVSYHGPNNGKNVKEKMDLLYTMLKEVTKEAQTNGVTDMILVGGDFN